MRLTAQRTIFIILVLLNCTHSFAQPSFQVQIGTEWTDFIMSADNDEHGNTIFVGTTSTAYANEIPYGRILKVYPNGNYIYKNIILPDTTVVLLQVRILPDGNYFVIAELKEGLPNSQNSNLSVLLFDTTLNIISRKCYEIPDGYIGIGDNCSMVEDNDGNLILATSVTYYNGPSYFGDFAFYKFNLEGDILASRVYETWYEAVVYSLAKVPNSNQLMINSHGYLPMTEGELMFIDYNLDIIRVKRIGSSWSTDFDSKHWLSDTTFIMAESFIQQREGLPSEYMMRACILDTATTYISITELNRPDTLEYLSQYEGMSYFNDTTIYISGSQSYNNFDISIPTEVFLYLIDKDLNIRGYKTLGDGHHYISKGTQASMDGGCFVWAMRYNIPYDDNEADIMIWKVMPEDMILYTDVSYLPPGRISGHAWPNPVGDELYISLEDFAQGETIRYRITDMQGRTCHNLKQTVNGNCLHTQTHNLDPGMYIYEVSGTGKKIISGKFIKQ